MENTITIRFIKPWQRFAKNQVATFPFPIADLLINRSKKAVKVESEKSETKKPKLEVKGKS